MKLARKLLATVLSVTLLTTGAAWATQAEDIPDYPITADMFEKLDELPGSGQTIEIAATAGQNGAVTLAPVTPLTEGGGIFGTVYCAIPADQIAKTPYLLIDCTAEAKGNMTAIVYWNNTANEKTLFHDAWAKDMAGTNAYDLAAIAGEKPDASTLLVVKLRQQYYPEDPRTGEVNIAGIKLSAAAPAGMILDTVDLLPTSGVRMTEEPFASTDTPVITTTDGVKLEWTDNSVNQTVYYRFELSQAQLDKTPLLQFDSGAKVGIISVKGYWSDSADPETEAKEILAYSGIPNLGTGFEKNVKEIMGENADPDAMLELVIGFHHEAQYVDLYPHIAYGSLKMNPPAGIPGIDDIEGALMLKSGDMATFNEEATIFVPEITRRGNGFTLSRPETATAEQTVGVVFWVVGREDVEELGTLGFNIPEGGTGSFNVGVYWAGFNGAGQIIEYKYEPVKAADLEGNNRFTFIDALSEVEGTLSASTAVVMVKMIYDPEDPATAVLDMDGIWLEETDPDAPGPILKPDDDKPNPPTGGAPASVLPLAGLAVLSGGAAFLLYRKRRG
mgnify:CR=1 FL=1